MDNSHQISPVGKQTCILYSNCCDKLIACTTCSQFICEKCFCNIVENLITNKICMKKISDASCPCCRGVYQEKNVKKFIGKKKYTNYLYMYDVVKFTMTANHDQFIRTLSTIPIIPFFEQFNPPRLELRINNETVTESSCKSMIDDFNKIYEAITNHCS